MPEVQAIGLYKGGDGDGTNQLCGCRARGTLNLRVTASRGSRSLNEKNESTGTTDTDLASINVYFIRPLRPSFGAH